MIGPLLILAGGIAEVLAVIIYFMGYAFWISFLIHGLAAIIVVQGIMRMPNTGGWALLGGSLTFLFPSLGYIGVVVILLTCRLRLGEDSPNDLVAEFQDYLTFKGHWGERRRFGADLSLDYFRQAKGKPLVDMAVDGDAKVKRAAVRLAGSHGGEVSVSILRQLATGNEPVLRYSASQELELLEDRWIRDLAVVEEECRKPTPNAEPCQQLATLYSEAADTGLFGEALNPFLRRKALQAWGDYRHRGGDLALAVPAEARLLLELNRAQEAVAILRKYGEVGYDRTPHWALLLAEAASAVGDADLLQAQIRIIKSLPKTPETRDFLAFLGET